MVSIRTESRSQRAWDALVMLTSIAACVEAPLRVVLNYPLGSWLWGGDALVTIVLLADLLRQFFTRIVDNKRIISDRGIIARRYLKGWFLTDLLAALPLDLMATAAGATLPGLGRALALARVLRLGRVGQFIERWKRASAINPSILRLGTLIFWIFITAHFVSCVWLFLGSGNAANSNPPELYAPDDHARNYLRAFYWTTTTIATIGYGDIAPITNVQTIFALFIELLGASMYGYLIGAIANMIANIDMAKAHHREQMEKIEVFMQHKAIPRDIQEKVRDYYQYIWETRRGYDEFALVNDFPAPLKVEILLFLNRAMIEKVPIFKGASPDFVREIVLNLSPVVFSPGEYVMRQGDLGHTMYFISRGSVEVVSADGRMIYATLHDGNFFGEIALLLSQPRTASIRAVDYADLYELGKETFERVLGRFPDFERQIRELARQRHEETTRSSTRPASSPPERER